MKYKLIGSNDLSNVVKTTLINRGITNWQEYLDLNKLDDQECYGLNNIHEAVECFAKHMERGSEVGILFDTDTDGICSGTIVYKYIKALSPDTVVHAILHRRPKAHGLSARDYDIPSGVKLLIVPDSSTNDVEECQELIDNGVEIIIADHHISSDDRPNPAIVMNNQMSEHYPNKDACGAHITYDFLKAVDEYFWTDYADQFIDLVALADIADVMSIKSFPTRAAINVGLESIENKMFKEIIKAQEFSTKGILSPFTISFYVSPLVNAFLRCATFEERQLLVRAFCEDESEVFFYTKRGEDLPTEENIYEHVVRLMKSHKGKQDRTKKKALPQVLNMTKDNDDKVAIIDVTKVLDNALTGVVAIKVSEELCKPVILLQRKDSDVYGGSARAFDNCQVEDLRSLVDECPYTNFANGHPSACGVEIPAGNIEKVREWLNQKLADVSMEKVYTVDFEVDADDLDSQMFLTLDQNKTLWGHQVDEPLFAIKNIYVTPENARICGKNRDTIQIYNEETNVKYIMFGCNESNELYQWLSENWDNEETYITVIGKLGLNLYEGKLDSQVVIKDVSVMPTVQD